MVPVVRSTMRAATGRLLGFSVANRKQVGSVQSGIGTDHGILTYSPDGKFVFLRAGNKLVVDLTRFEVVKELSLGFRPTAMVWTGRVDR